MLFTIELPDVCHTKHAILDRWQEVCADETLAKMEGRIETNLQGQVMMSPPPAFDHGVGVWKIQQELSKRLGGLAIPECPVLTADGVRAADIGWYPAKEDLAMLAAGVPDRPPPICIEVLSPSNTPSEMAIKRRLYFDAGAAECWQCDRDSAIEFYTAEKPDTPKSTSKRCPTFPQHLKDEPPANANP